MPIRKKWVSLEELDEFLGGNWDPASHSHDNRYYTEAELDAGQLDDRYYTEAEMDAVSGYFEEDGNGDMQPIAATDPVWDNCFELDGNDDIMPKAVAFDYDDHGDIALIY